MSCEYQIFQVNFTYNVFLKFQLFLVLKSMTKDLQSCYTLDQREIIDKQMKTLGSSITWLEVRKFRSQAYMNTVRIEDKFLDICWCVQAVKTVLVYRLSIRDSSETANWGVQADHWGRVLMPSCQLLWCRNGQMGGMRKSDLLLIEGKSWSRVHHDRSCPKCHLPMYLPIYQDCASESLYVQLNIFPLWRYSRPFTVFMYIDTNGLFVQLVKS